METPITFEIRAWNNLSVLLAVVFLVFWIVAGTYMAGVYPSRCPMLAELCESSRLKL